MDNDKNKKHILFLSEATQYADVVFAQIKKNYPDEYTIEWFAGEPGDAPVEFARWSIVLIADIDYIFSVYESRHVNIQHLHPAPMPEYSTSRALHEQWIDNKLVSCITLVQMGNGVNEIKAVRPFSTVVGSAIGSIPEISAIAGKCAVELFYNYNNGIRR